MSELDGLNYDRLVLNENVHKIVGKLSKLQSGSTGEVNVEEGSFWLAAGLGQLIDTTPDDIIEESLDDIIILSKKELIEFIKNKK